MKVSLKNCALCNAPLSAKYPLPGSTLWGHKTYICSTHVANSKLSHYYIEVNGSLYTEIIHVPPFVIVNISNKETSDIYPFIGNGSGHITRRKLIASIPKLPITTEAKLTERLKILVLFS